jgi:hypothetical protein
MMAAVHRYDGYVAQSTGDGIFAMFGAPVAHEDHPQRALHAALAIQEELRSYGERIKGTRNKAVEARIGINTGEVVLRMVNTGGHTEYAPVGHVVNLTARLQTVAPAGGVVVSDDTRKLVEGYFELRALESATLKGIPEPVNVYEVVSTGPLRGHFDVAARRGLTKFVGRERELQQIRYALVYRPNALTCRGDLRLKLAQTELAEADFHEAIALAQKMQAKAFELRATISLARLLDQQGKRDEARTMLADIYNWFTEGFDTADLKDAKALIGELDD